MSVSRLVKELVTEVICLTDEGKKYQRSAWTPAQLAKQGNIRKVYIKALPRKMTLLAKPGLQLR